MTLVPEKRVDKNGVLTTKHVRADVKSAVSKASMPAPVATNETTKHKMSAAQMKRKPREYSLAMYDMDIELQGTAQGKLSFTASNAEMLDVLSVVDKPGSALRLLNLGITTAEEARAYMRRLGVEQPSHERAELIKIVAGRGMGMNFFLDHVEVFEEAIRDNPDRDPENAVDSVIFYTSKLGMGNNRETQDAILDGHISYEDIKTIGAVRLASRKRMSVMHGVLVKLNSGTADYTAEDMKELIRMAASEDMIDPSLGSVLKMVEPVGIKTILGLPQLQRVASAHDHYHHSLKWESHPDKMERAAYAVRVLKESGGDGTHADFDRFYAENIPAEVAGSVIAGGGTVLTAKAIHEERIAPSVAGGWL